MKEMYLEEDINKMYLLIHGSEYIKEPEAAIPISDNSDIPDDGSTCI